MAEQGSNYQAVEDDAKQLLVLSAIESLKAAITFLEAATKPQTTDFYQKTLEAIKTAQHNGDLKL